MVPNKYKWAAPEGTQPPPDVNPLANSLTDIICNGLDLNEHYISLVNKVGLHSCNGYCLKFKRKGKDDKNKGSKYCRFHFGELDPETKKTPGKDLHPFEAKIVTGEHPRFEGPRDHPRLIMHIKMKLLTWLANCDTQPIIDDNFLALLRYITGYACKGCSTTEDLLHIYKHLLDNANEQDSVRNVAQKLLMKMIGMVDISAAAADYLNTGGKLYHSTRRIRRIGLSGFRALDQTGSGGSVTRATPLDKFLGAERPADNPEISLWDWAKICNCAKSNVCGADHAPVFTGLPLKPSWPVSEEFAKGHLMIYSKGTWEKTDDLKNGHETFIDAFAEFLESDECPTSLTKVLEEAKAKYEKKKNGPSRKRIQNNLSSQSSFYSQSTDSQLSEGNVGLGACLLKDLAEQNANFIEDPLNTDPLPDGGPNFDWHKYGEECLGLLPPADATNWLKSVSNQAEQDEFDKADRYNLPCCNLRLANPLQRVAIAIVVKRLLLIKQNMLPPNTEPIRLLIQGTAGTGKTYVINALTYVARRLFQRNGAAMNLAPTGAASVLIPDGRTVHSMTTIPRNKKELKTAQLADYPMNDRALKKLRKLTGTHQPEYPLKLMLLNIDERGQCEKRVVAWCSQRFNEATNAPNCIFGNIPVTTFDGDLGQLGPVASTDLHVAPKSTDGPDTLAGYAIYHSFNEYIVLTETMRQGPDQINLLARLLRIRNGTITQQDWININARYEHELSHQEKPMFTHDKIITLMETWAEVNEENHNKLRQLGEPVAVVPSVGNGKHHSKIEKQCGQIMHKALLAVGSTVILTKNQMGLTSSGLNNGAMGKIISILYASNQGLPDFPEVVVVDFPRYKGPKWIPQHPTWVPIPVNEGRCENNCCVRRGIPLMPGYAIPIAKSQGMTIGDGKQATHARIKLQSAKIMEQLSLGTTYTALSRVEKEVNWALVEKIPEDKLLYINDHPHMPARMTEEKRLKALSDETVKKNEQYANGYSSYIALLQELDEACNDSITDSICNTDCLECVCVICKHKFSQ